MSNLDRADAAEVCQGRPSAGEVQEVEPLVADLGAITVRRLLPRRVRRLVGPWCFLDVFGPVAADGKTMDVPPHPHIGLQTVTWLFAGAVLHKDSLGSEALAVPGALNLMTAGRGIAHSEETPAAFAGPLHGVQLWVALPDAVREVDPAFDHHPGRPQADLPGGRATVILGALAGVAAPGRTFSPIVGADLTIDGAARMIVPLDPAFEHAVVPIEGDLSLDARPLLSERLYYLGTGRTEVCLGATAHAGGRALLLGGAPLGETILMWWNFVARTSAEIATAREDWQAGRRFGEVTAYAGSRLDAPPFVARPVPANPMS
jgi:redox-sensitive bicupin YhaK (pirin superfamily)